jgi:hypothetical protein
MIVWRKSGREEDLCLVNNFFCLDFLLTFFSRRNILDLLEEAPELRIL